MANKPIINPWDDTLSGLVRKSKVSIKITSPFIKSKTTNRILAVQRDSAELRVISSFKLMNFYLRVSDFAAIEAIIKSNGVVKNNHLLHAKTYIFDDKKAVVTSANLTEAGLKYNYEYGVLLDEKKLVKKIVRDFELLYNNKNTGDIDLQKISTAKGILNHLPKEKRITLPKIEELTKTDEIDIYTGGIDSIRSSLDGWNLATFECLTKIKQDEFSLKDVYQFENELSVAFPINKFIKPKVRQQLQELRDIGLVEFLGNGKYRKLWKGGE